MGKYKRKTILFLCLYEFLLLLFCAEVENK